MYGAPSYVPVTFIPSTVVKSNSNFVPLSDTVIVPPLMMARDMRPSGARYVMYAPLTTVSPNTDILVPCCSVKGR